MMRNYALPVSLVLLLAVSFGMIAGTPTTAVPSSNIGTTTVPESATIDATQKATSDVSSQNAETPLATTPIPEINSNQSNPLSDQTTVAPAVPVTPNHSSPLTNQVSAARAVMVSSEQIGPSSNETTATPAVTPGQTNTTEAPPPTIPQTTAHEELPTEAAAPRLSSFTLLLELLFSTLILLLAL